MIRAIAFCLLFTGLYPPLVASAPPYDPAAPAAAVPFVPAPLSPDAALGDADWRSANSAVGALTRGHIDILRWEAENRPPSVEATVPAGEPLMPAEAVRIALTQRPDLFATEEMSTLERAQADIAAIAFAREVHRAWIAAVAAEQGLEFARQAFEAMRVGTDLALGMTRVGNWGRDRLWREQVALADSGIRLAQARQEATSARETLVRLLGLWGDAAAIHLPTALPDLPDAPMSSEGLEATALRNAPPLSLAAIAAERAQRGLASRTRSMWDDAVRDALERMEPPESTQTVAASNVTNPLGTLLTAAPLLERRDLPFGHEAAQAARTQARAVALAVAIRSQVREAYHHYRVTYDIARAAEENQRLGVEMQEDVLQRYNGMLKSTWDLLASARDGVDGTAAALQARRDFWWAHTNLQAVLAGADYPGPDAIGGGERAANAGGH